MARIESYPKVILTKEEIEILRKAQNIFNTLDVDDNNGYIFDKCDSSDASWYWIDSFISNLIYISEVEQNV